MKLFDKSFPQHFPKLIAKSYKPNEWRSKNFPLQKVALNNKKLSRDLEKLCAEKEGSLTYGGFISEEMYGQNGYYNTHKDFGKTDVEKVWPKAIINICRENSISSVLEIGSGNGSLGIKTLKLAKKDNVNLTWYGVEVNEKLLKKMKVSVEKGGFKNFMPLNSIENLQRKKYLLIFPFSLDSMTNEVAVNTGENISFADSLLGVKVSGGILQEVIFDKIGLENKDLLLTQGVFSLRGFSFDFTSWKLHPYQRLYIPINAYLSILTSLKKIEDSSVILIMDEIKPPPNPNQTFHLAAPRVLNKNKRDYDIVYDAYKNTGENLWYFPFYLKPFLDFLRQAGFYDVVFDIDVKMASRLGKEKWNKPGLYLCNAIMGKYKRKTNANTFKISSPV